MRLDQSHVYFRLWLILLGLGITTWTAPAWSQNRQADVQRDIDILETVLCQVLGQGESSRFWGGSCRGIYLEGFGIIFNVPFDHSFGLTAAPKVWTAKSAGYKNLAESYYAAVSPGPTDSSRAEQRQQLVQKLKKDLSHFFTRYAGAVRGVAPGEVMAVMVDWTGAAEAFFQGKSAENGARHFYASVSQEKLAQLRQMQNPESAIQFHDKTGNEDLNRELDIFDNILDKTMANPDGGHMPLPGKTVRSMYLPGYGAVVMMNLHEFSAIAVPALEKSTGVLEVSGVTKTRNEHRAKRIPALKENIVDVLARFGGSLRSLKPEETVLVQVDLSRGFGEESSKGFSCKVRMADIAQVYAGKISADAFKNTVQISDF